MTTQISSDEEVPEKKVELNNSSKEIPYKVKAGAFLTTAAGKE